MTSNRISIERRAASVKLYFQNYSIIDTGRWYCSTYGTPAASGDLIRKWHDYWKPLIFTKIMIRNSFQDLIGWIFFSGLITYQIHRFHPPQLW